MLPYVALTGAIAVMAFLSPQRRVYGVLWVATFAALLVFVGLRHQVGMDWFNYIAKVEIWARIPPAYILAQLEPAYNLTSWAAGQTGWGIYAVNLLVALIFLLGLFRYAQATPSPWIALLVAMPYLVIAIGMSANRQAAAIGILLWLTAVWNRISPPRRLAYVFVAALFHVSAVIYAALVLRELRIPLWLKIAIGAAIAPVAWYLLSVGQAVDAYGRNYILGGGEVESGGALFHAMLNAGPALVYFALPRYREILLPDAMHRDLARLSIALLVAAVFFSTAADRMSLYTFPVSMYIGAALPLVLSGRASRIAYRYAGAVFFVAITVLWLSASNSSRAWLPYRNILSVPSYQWQLCCRHL